VCGSRGGILTKVVFLLDLHSLLHLLRQQLVLPLDTEHPAVDALAGIPGVPAVPIGFLHRQVEDRGSSVRNVVVAGNEGGNSAGRRRARGRGGRGRSGGLALKGVGA